MSPNAERGARRAGASILEFVSHGLSDSHFIDLLMTIASNAAEDPVFTQWNALVLEIFYLLFRGVKPISLAGDQTKVNRTCLTPSSLY